MSLPGRSAATDDVQHVERGLYTLKDNSIAGKRIVSARQGDDMIIDGGEDDE